jgi:hypothetical protein
MEHYVEALKDHYGDQLAVAYRSQLKVRTQLSSEVLQEFAATIQQVAHWTVVRLPEYHIQKDAAYAFVNGMKDGSIAIPPHGW